MDHRLLSVALITFFTCSLFAIDSTIVFRQVSHEEVFLIAGQEQKPVFLYFHFDGCGACMKMEKTCFIDEEVATFYNSNFINYEVNTRKGVGIEINKTYNIRSHPTFLYLTAQGEVIHRLVGIFTPKEFIESGQAVLNGESTLSVMDKSYARGNRDPGFLLHYCYQLRDAHTLDSAKVSTYLNTQSDEQLAEEHNIKFVYEFALHHHNVMIPFGSREFQFLLDHQDLFAEYFERDQISARIVFILNHTMSAAIEAQDAVLFNEAVDILQEYNTGEPYFFKEMDGRMTGMTMGTDLVLSAEMAYHKKSGDQNKFNKALTENIDKIWNDSDALNSIAWEYYEGEDDSDLLERAKSWVIRSIELQSNYYNNDTYAALLYKLGDYDAALTQAEAAISIAKSNGQDYTATESLVRKIQDAKEN